MTLQDLGNIGEFTAAIATLVTLVYLALQIRQNTRTVRTSTYQAVLNSLRSDNELILAHPHLERVYRVGRRNPTALTDEERPLFRLLVAQLFFNHEEVFLLHQHGVIDDDFAKRRQIMLQALVSQPGVSQWWTGSAKNRSSYDTGFRELVESLLGKVTAQDEPAA